MKGLFLDRDGAINVDNNYVYKIEDFIFTDYIFDLCREAKNKGYLIFVITNQAGIGRGIYSEAEFSVLNNWMINVFSSHNINIEKVYFCPFHKEYGIGYYKKDSFDRKPNPGMLIKAMDEFGISINDSVLIGDKRSDILAGQAAGVKKNILISQENRVADESFIQVSSLKKAINYL